MYGSHVAYEANTPITIKASSIMTIAGPVYDFYGAAPLFCKPKSGFGEGGDYLGELVLGSKLVNTAIELKMMQKETCIAICDVDADNPSDLFAGHPIEYTESSYPSQRTFYRFRKFPRATVTVDSLPIISSLRFEQLPANIKVLISDEIAKPGEEFYANGVPIFDKKGVFINHWNIKIQVEQNFSYRLVGGFMGIGGERISIPTYTIVGATVESSSVLDEKECMKESNGEIVETLPLDAKENLQWFYSVDFEIVDHLSYTTRWNKALAALKYDIVTHDGNRAFFTIQRDPISEPFWYIILDTAFLELLLVAVLISLVIMSLHGDFVKQGDDVILGLDTREMSPWQLLKFDVFRKPAHSTILCALVGGGIQVLLAVLPVGAAIIFKIIPEEHKGRIIHWAIVFWGLAGFPSGYITCRLYRMFDSPNWKLTVLRTGLMIPGGVLSWALIINMLTYIFSLMDRSPIPPKPDTWSIIRLTCFWVFFSLPMVSAGCYFGLRATPIELPVEPSKLPRPAPGLNISYLMIILTTGALVHASSISLVDALVRMVFTDQGTDNSMEVAFSGMLWFLVTVMASVAATFYFISDNVWNWWWYSFCAPASCGLWIVFLLLLQARARVQSLAEIVIYTGLVGVASSAFALVAGAIGFMASLAFNFYIYSRIKVD